MKKLLTVCLTLAPCALMAASNKINMITYFPVPYVAYSQVNASQQMDVGLTNVCHMSLGCEESQSPLIAPQTNIHTGRLDLNNGRGILGQNITLGSNSVSGHGHLAFNNVRIQTGNIQSVNAAENITVTTELNLFKHKFPACTDHHSSGQMGWQSLKLQGANSAELYLACGKTVTASEEEPSSDCSDAAYKEGHKSTCCPGTPETDSICWEHTWGPLEPVALNSTQTVTWAHKAIHGVCDAFVAGVYWHEEDGTMTPWDDRTQILTAPESSSNIYNYNLIVGMDPIKEGGCSAGSKFLYNVSLGWLIARKSSYFNNISSVSDGLHCKADFKNWPGHSCQVSRKGW